MIILNFCTEHWSLDGVEGLEYCWVLFEFCSMHFFRDIDKCVVAYDLEEKAPLHTEKLILVLEKTSESHGKQ